MAPLDIGVGSPQAVKIWSPLLMLQIIRKTYYSRFSGKGPDNPIQILNDLTKGAGDTIKFDLLEQMAGYGVSKNATLEGNESNLVYRQDQILIEQTRLGHSWERMSQQRTLHTLRMDAQRNLSDRWARIMDEAMFAQLAGTAGANAALATWLNTDHGANPLELVDADHFVDRAGTPFDLSAIDTLRWKAETLETPIQPIRAEGRDVYLLFIRPEQAFSLQTDSDWRTLQANADVRGSENKLFTGALGMWNDCVIHVSNYLPSGASAYATPAATDRFAVLAGKQAGAVAFGNPIAKIDEETYGTDFIFAWIERAGNTDYGRIKGVSANAIWGCKRVTFPDAGAVQRTFGNLVLRTTDAAVA